MTFSDHIIDEYILGGVCTERIEAAFTHRCQCCNTWCCVVVYFHTAHPSLKFQLTNLQGNSFPFIFMNRKMLSLHNWTIYTAAKALPP